MEKVEVSKEFVLRAYEKACYTWKKNIEKEIPDLFKYEFQVGDWLVKEWIDGSGDIDIFKVSKVEVSKLFHDLPYYRNGILLRENFGIACEDPMACEGPNDTRYKLRKATYNEIQDYLIKEAERRGFEKGVLYKALRAYNSKRSIGVYKISRPFYYHDEEDGLVCGMGYIYYQGQWAEIAEDTLNEKEVEIDGKKYKLTLL